MNSCLIFFFFLTKNFGPNLCICTLPHSLSTLWLYRTRRQHIAELAELTELRELRVKEKHTLRLMELEYEIKLRDEETKKLGAFFLICYFILCDFVFFLSYVSFKQSINLVENYARSFDSKATNKLPSTSPPSFCLLG